MIRNDAMIRYLLLSGMQKLFTLFLNSNLSSWCDSFKYEKKPPGPTAAAAEERCVLSPFLCSGPVSNILDQSILRGVGILQVAKRVFQKEGM